MIFVSCFARHDSSLPSKSFGMVKYQAYFADADGEFTNYRAFACYSDEQAIEWTKQLMDQRPAELRSGARVVRRLYPPDNRQTKS